MALHGSVQVNGISVGSWRALCKSRDADGYGTYRWEVSFLEPPETPREAVLPRRLIKRHGTLVHRYADGALVLASEVLRAATSERDPDLNGEPAHA